MDQKTIYGQNMFWLINGNALLGMILSFRKSFDKWMNTFAQQTLLLSLLLIKLLCLHKYKSYVICKSCRIKRKSCVPFCRKMQKYVRNQREAQTSLMYNMPTSQSQGPGKKNSTNTVRFGFPSNKDIVIELPLVDYTSRWQKVN